MDTSALLLFTTLCALATVVAIAAVAAHSILNARNARARLTSLESRTSRLTRDLRAAGVDTTIQGTVADLVVAVNECNARQRQQFGKLWARLGRLETPDEQTPEPEPVDDATRRDQLRSALLPKSLAGKVEAMNRGMAPQPEE